MLDHMRAPLSAQLEPSQLKDVLAAGRAWMNEAKTRLAPEVFMEIRRISYSFLADRAQEWLASEGIPLEPFIHARKGPAPASDPRLPAVEAEIERTQAPPALDLSSLNPSPDLWIRDPSLFKAFIKCKDSEAAFLDLASMQVIWVTEDQGMFGPPVGGAEYQYIRIPTVDTQEQLSFAFTCLEGQLTSANKERLYTAGPRWADELEQVLPADQWRTFKRARTTWVARRAQAWLAQHRIPSGSFISPFRGSGAQDPLARASETRLLPADPAQDLRALVHRAVDLMTESEIHELRFPPRILLALVSASKGS
jgi:hypothetical protein